ncbi:hypothetical protein PFNF54_01969 [Plasmodium falciparum NF54]|uniref:Transmembrane protein n=1 Tax=Plasmodium falciparum (isolate NF54) TaxID=5843 RepID=W7K8B5_PLAFO|nr:hypothetical protein PFNF54_01969 [Plasmodium falciparum NF54]
MYNIEIQNKLISHQVKKYKMQNVQIIKSNINYTNNNYFNVIITYINIFTYIYIYIYIYLFKYLIRYIIKKNNNVYK